MKWRDASNENPGHSVYYAIPERDKDILYVIRQKKKTPDFTPKGWRVFVRNQKSDPLVTIFSAKTRKEAKAFIEDLEKALASN